MSEIEVPQPTVTLATASRATKAPVTSAYLAWICDTALKTDDPRALAEVRRYAKEIMDSLGEPEVEKALTIEDDEDVNEARIAAVYQALSESAPLRVSGETRKKLIERGMSREAKIGSAFNELLSGLDRSLMPLTLPFAEAPIVTLTEQRHLRINPSVEESWPESAPLISCGLTPLAVAAAAGSVWPLANRLKTGPSGILSPSDPVILCFVWCKTPPARWEQFSQSLVREVLQVTHCGATTAKILIDWLINVSLVKPWTFRGARAERHDFGVELVEEPDFAGLDLIDLWKKTGDAIGQSSQGQLPADAESVETPASLAATQ